jgi:hypothetical protein
MRNCSLRSDCSEAAQESEVWKNAYTSFVCLASFRSRPIDTTWISRIHLAISRECGLEGGRRYTSASAPKLLEWGQQRNHTAGDVER